MTTEPTQRRGRGRPREVVRRRPGEGTPLDRGPAHYPPTTRAILDAAHRVVLRQGAKDLTMVAVAREANVDITTISYHFGTRVGLIEGLMDRLYGEQIAAFMADLEHLSSAAERVHAYFECVRSMYTDIEASQAYFEIVTLALRDPALRARLAQLNQWTVTAFSEAFDGTPTPEQRLAAELTFAAVDGIDLHRAIAANDDYPVESLLQLFETLVLSTLVGDQTEPVSDE